MSNGQQKLTFPIRGSENAVKAPSRSLAFKRLVAKLEFCLSSKLVSRVHPSICISYVSRTVANRILEK